MSTWAPSKRARMERIDAEAEALIRDLGDRRLPGGAPKGARGQFRRDRRGLGSRRAGGCAQDGQPRRPQSLDPAGDEHLLRARSRAGRGARGSTPPEPEVEFGRSRNASRSPPASPRRSRSGSSSWARARIPDLRSCGRTRSAPPTFPPRSSPPRSPPGRPKRSALRILDREGHEVFGRQKVAGR